MRTEENALESHARLLARIVRVLLARESFETLADVTEALKVECARLRIRCTPDDLGDAFRLIESNRPIVPERVPLERHAPPPAPAIGRRQAAKILADLGVAHVRTMPALQLHELTHDELDRRHWHADQRRAYVLIQALILETAQRADELERRADELEAALGINHEAQP